MKKTLSLFLSLILLISSTAVPAIAWDEAGNTVTAYVTVSRYGEIVDDKNGDDIAMLPVELSGEETYDLNDVFVALHDMSYVGGTDGYATADGDWGLYVTKFWGDESGNFRYMVNSEYAMGLADAVDTGDHIEFSINQNTVYAELESYTKFDRQAIRVYKNEDVELTLTQASYTADGLVFSACPDATVTVNGVATESVTDADGKATVSFFEAGRYVVSATKTKVAADATVTAITAPVSVVTVMALPEEQLHNIAEKYTTSEIIEDVNMHWFIANFADYLTAYPETENKLTEEEKQACVDALIEFADEAESQSDLAKSIIALRSLGYDPRNTYTKNGEALDIVSKLTALIAEDSVTAPYYEYTLPYVLTALQQGEDYASEETINLLINTAVSIKSAWQDTSWGTDGAAPMLRALAPYYETNTVVAGIIDETIEIVKNYQGQNGSMGNAASTGLAIAGLASVGVDPETVVKNGNDMLYGLMCDSNETFDGFEPMNNTFGTDQGMRGLIAWKLFAMDKYIYDFAAYPANEARATLDVAPTPTPTPTVRPSYGGGGGVRRTPVPTVAPTATPTPEPQGLPNKNEDVKSKPVTDADKTFEDIKGHKNQIAIEALASRGIIDGMDDKTYCPDETMTRAQFAAIVVRAIGVPEKPGFDFDDVNETDWFYSYVNTAYYYGIINGVSDTEFNPDGEITREEAATMVARAAKLCGMNTDMGEDGARNTLAEFPDYITVSDWAMQSVAFGYYEELLDKDVINIEPKDKITRAEMAQIIYNTLGKAKLI